MNIAARLEGIAEPGGICISRQARDHLLEKISFTCEKLGLRTLKNIAKPVEVYSVNFGSVSMTQEIKYSARDTNLPSGRRRRPLKGSPPSAAQTERAVFPHSAFMNGFARSGEKVSARQG